MQTARAVAGFATGIQPVLALGDEPRVVGSLEGAADFIVTLFTVSGADILRARHLREHHRLMTECAAGGSGQQQNQSAGGERQISTAPGARRQQVDEGNFFHANSWLSVILRIVGKRAVAGGPLFIGIIPVQSRFARSATIECHKGRCGRRSCRHTTPDTNRSGPS